MFEDASDRKRKMLALDYNPCSHCGGDPRTEQFVAYRDRLSRVSGCCRASVASVPGVDPEHIAEMSLPIPSWQGNRS